MTNVEFEVHDSEIIEATNSKFQSCVFFDCEFVGVNNVFRDCRFRFSGTALFPNRSTLVDCLIESNSKTQE